jgi:hypothetical protein
MSGHIDASVDWMGSYNSVIVPGNGIKAIGITGQRQVIDKVPLIPGTEHLLVDLGLYSMSNTDPSLFKELYQIFNSSQDERTDTYCKNDYGRSAKVEMNNLNKIYELNKIRWKGIISASGIKPE